MYYDVRHLNSPRCVGIDAKNSFSAALQFAKEEGLEENKYYTLYNIEVRHPKTKKSKFYVVERKTEIKLKCKAMDNGIS